MATNIGTHAAALIEAVHEITYNLQGLGAIGTCMTSNQEPEAFYNLVEFLTKLQSNRVSELTHYLETTVLPIVKHINTPGAK